MARRELDLKNAPWRDRRPDNQFYGYYISFDPTGCEPVDEVLRAVACAAKNYHSTEYWGDADPESQSHLDWVQFAAQAAADELDRLRAENAALRERVESFETVHPSHQWHEDDGPVLWYLLPVCEPAFHVGTPSDSDWPWDGDTPESKIGWARIPNPCRGISQANPAAQEGKEASDGN